MVVMDQATKAYLVTTIPLLRREVAERARNRQTGQRLQPQLVRLISSKHPFGTYDDHVMRREANHACTA